MKAIFWQYFKFWFWVAFIVQFCGCSTPQKPKGFELPPALRETFRGGALKGLEEADSPELGMPNPYDRVSHVCTSTPIYNLWGQFVRTDVRCF